MNILSNLDLLSVGITIAAIALLGFVVYFNNPKSATNKTFLWFCILTIAWGTFNFLSYQITTPEVAFWLLRLSIFTAVWHTLLIFQLLYIFPDDEFKPPKWYSNILFPVALASALINLTSLTFESISEISPEGRIIKIANGPGIALFSMVVFGFVIGGISLFIKKIKNKQKIRPEQARPVLLGIVSTFLLILLFNFIFPAFLNNTHFINFGAIFIFPFILGSAYSIIKHKLLNIKVISTQILTFVLAIVVLLDVITSENITILLFRSAIFVLVICIGILLIKSVMREVKQREQLEILTKELEDANEKLKALDIARSEFITIASHQLRTPPATIKWYLSSVLAGDFGKLSDEQKTVLEKANRTNNAQISLIDDMLNVSRIERGKMEFLFEKVDLMPLAQFAYEQLIPAATEKGLKLIFEKLQNPLPSLMADKEKIRQVMNNLIDNAIKYTKTGSITVKIWREAEEIKFAVTDTGKGINPSEANSLFEKFSRGKESVKQSAGLGLGLYVAKIVIEQHRGKIWAESKGEGLGSSFIFSIPINNNLSETTLLDLTRK